jgi:hypothetical protein
VNASRDADADGRKEQVFFLSRTQANFGYQHKKFTASLTELKSYFHSHGFPLRQDFVRGPLIHTLHLAF